METDFNFFIQNGFAIATAIYLLYERAKFNEKITLTLERVSETLDRIEARVK